MNEYCTIQLGGTLPLITTAIHNGHKLDDQLLDLSGLSDLVRLMEEDPFTGLWAKQSMNHIIALRSRFEFDLNRPPEKAIYINPEDAWGLNLWKTKPSEIQLAESLSRYSGIYKDIYKGMNKLIKKHGKIVILDFHSYNYRREGPDGPQADVALNPEINLGTGTMDREYWAPVVDRFIEDLKNVNYHGRTLDIRENIKFKGGYFPKWIHENFKEKACCISVEAKKFFMDEWTGEPDWEKTFGLRDAFGETIPGLLKEISLMKSNTQKEFASE